MNSAMRFLPTKASMRSIASMDRRTTVGFTFSGGRPIRTELADIGKFIKSSPKAISLIDTITDIGYESNISKREMVMTFNSTLSTCRFCKGSSMDGDGMVKYGVRHYAHFKCYLDAGKSLDDLHSWQVGQFPFRLLKDRGLDGFAKNIAKGMATSRTLGLS